MKKEFVLSDEWRILRNAVSIYYKKIERDISSVIYSDVEKSFERIYSKEQIKTLQQNKTSNTLSIVYNSIYKKFFKINNKEDFFKSPKWQNKLSCEDLTRLILLLQRSSQIVKRDCSDYSYIEAMINEIKNEEFLSLNKIDNNRGFEKCRPFPKSEIENKDNFKFVFKKYVENIYFDYTKEHCCRPLRQYLLGVFEFTAKNSLIKTKRDKNSFIKTKIRINRNKNIILGEERKEIGLTYDGEMVYEITDENGEKKYLVNNIEVPYDEITFNDKNESEEEQLLDIEKFKENNSKCYKSKQIKNEESKEDYIQPTLF